MKKLFCLLLLGALLLGPGLISEIYAEQGARVGYDDYYFPPGSLEYMLMPGGPIVGPSVEPPGGGSLSP